ncbi:MAG TPA: helix-turn-helix transcriptional regulator [Thermoanaerobaculia bacterium]|jgi:tetratricopeptide (TPR) repeat protein|nr:helix-turn-helix transcriptional regulator [Thermoanaerobaculia bacterium]
MDPTIPPPLSLALDFLRTRQGWTQKKLAEATGIPANLISDYERGRKTLSRERLESMVAVMGLRSKAVDSALDFLQKTRPGFGEAGPPSAQSQRIEAVAAESGRMMAGFTRSLLGMLTAEACALEARQQARALWARLKRLPATQRRALVEKSAELRTWALCELLCDESIKAAGDSADRALELADLALRVAELIPGEEPWRSRVQGYAWAHVGNARRVQGDLPGADEAFGRSQKLWLAGSHGDSGLLDEARVLDLEVSLRRDQTRFAEALDLLDRALAVDRGVLAKHLLVNKANALLGVGDYEKAIAILHQATPLVEADGESRLLFALKFNLAANLYFLGRYDETEALMPLLWKLVNQLGKDLDFVRLHWLEARVSTGLGRTEQAIEGLSRVREEFTSRGIAYDMALVSLELAVLYLEQQRTPEVRTLARQMTPVFRAQGVHKGALAALRLFLDAVEREVVTVEFARKLVAYFLRAQYDPGLRFEDIQDDL